MSACRSGSPRGRPGRHAAAECRTLRWSRIKVVRDALDLRAFDPVKALPKSAEYLRELVAEFGNLGLAAAAYNAGPRREHDWLAGRGRLPDQTRAYVLAITGHSVDEWIQSDRESAAPSGADAGEQSCDELTALFTANTHGQKSIKDNERLASTTPPTDMQSTHRWLTAKLVQAPKPPSERAVRDSSRY